jgi:hypothetical protein
VVAVIIDWVTIGLWLTGEPAKRQRIRMSGREE